MADKKAQISADTIKATREAGGKRMLAVKQDLPRANPIRSTRR